MDAMFGGIHSILDQQADDQQGWSMVVVPPSAGSMNRHTWGAVCWVPAVSS